MTSPPFFIIGTPRSGTTMLQMALNRHTDVVIPPETHFFHIMKRPFSGQLRHWKRIQTALEIAMPPPHSRITCGEPARREFGRLLGAYCDRLGRVPKLLGEKSPEHQLTVPEILDTYPDAKLILIYRDGRDVALSLSKAPWMPSSLEAGFIVWLHYYAIQRCLVTQHAGNILCVKYEALVNNPKAQLSTLCDFLGIDFQEQMASGSGNHRGIRPDEYHKNNALEAINTNRIGSSRREVDAHRVIALERWGGWALSELGYELTRNYSFRYPSLRILCSYLRLSMEVLTRHCQCRCDDILETSFYHANRPISKS